MELSSRLVERILARLGVTGRGSAFHLLDAARTGGHQVRMTLVALWEREGAFVSPALLYELRLRWDLQATLTDVRDRLTEAMPGVGFLKGLEVAELYPEGVLREMTDLDVLVPDRATLWAALAWMAGEGWSVADLSVLEVAGRRHLVVGVARPARDPQVLPPQSVELSTIPFAGARGAIPPSEWLPERDRPLLKNLVALMNELAENRLAIPTPRARDVLDGAVLLEALRGQEPDAFEAVRRHGFEFEWFELADLLRAFDLLPDGFGAAPFARPPRPRSREASARLRRLRSPAGAAAGWYQRAMAAERRSSLQARAGRLLERAVSPSAVLAAGLPLFGIQVDPRPSAPDLELDERGTLATARTPVGTFALTFTDSVDRGRFERAGLIPATGA
jgi:Uncharacterised nucleotidyltransferase